MWWSRRRAVQAGLAGLGLAGCGFAPVHGPGGTAGGPLFGAVAIDPPRDAGGFAFVRHLEYRLGVTETPRYQLSARIRVSEDFVGVLPDQVITRYQLIGRAEFEFRDIASGDVLSEGTVDTFTGYSATRTPFATQTAKRDAEERLMVALADRVVARLQATAGDWR